MPYFEELLPGILRLAVPFEGIYTSVFALEGEEGWILADSGSNDSDAESVILPALEKEGIRPVMLAVTHDHGDHSGGFVALTRAFPHAVTAAGKPEVSGVRITHVLKDGEVLGGRFKVLSLPGHTEDCFGFWDLRENAVITGDAVQLYGVTRWGTGVALPIEYLATHEKLLALAPEHIITSHDYTPLGFRADGRDRAAKYLMVSRECFAEVRDFTRQHRGASPEAIAKAFDMTHGGCPFMQPSTAAAILAAYAGK